MRKPTKPFRVLYREFLFRIVDRELLSAYATGDSSQLLLQLVSLLAFLSALFSVPALANPSGPPQLRLAFAWSVEHFLIATTMLTVGLFAVLSWTSMFPDYRDVLVLGPLPIRAHTILAAKLAAVATALGVTVLVLHAVAGIVWPAALNKTERAHAIPAVTFDPAIPPVGAADLQAVMDRDLASARRDGALAPEAGGALAIGVYRRGVRRVFTYGAARLDSIFDLASVTKPFTGLLLARMVEVGQVRLDEPVRELIPAARLPRPAGREITLLDLATHHAGLPLVPPNLRPADRMNPFADYDLSRLYAYMRSRGVMSRPSAPYAYSNVGFGLLGHALTVRAKLDYGGLIREVITEPLGLHDIAVELSPEQKRRLLPGHDDERDPVPAWDIGAFAGAGGLHATPSDLLAWLEANLHPERLHSATLSAAVASSHVPRAGMGSGMRVALAWTVDPASGSLSHKGNGGGFSADVFFNPSDDVAAVVLSNVVVGTAISADVVGEHVRARLFGKPALSIAEVVLPATGGVGHWLRMAAAYWITMFASGVFILGSIMGLQSLAAGLLPYGYVARASSVLQLVAFTLIAGVYFLQPSLATPGEVLLAQHSGVLGWSPSYWFLGLFQLLSGSPALALLGRRAIVALGVAVAGTGIAYTLSYVHTLRRIAEQPDIPPSRPALRWLPPFGRALSTAIGHFTIRTLARSAQHRVIVAFYWGIGLAITAVLLKTPRVRSVDATGGWQDTSIALVLSSLVMMCVAVAAAKAAFSLPVDLRANWIFRTLPLRGGAPLVTARRNAFFAASVVPVWAIAAPVFLMKWPMGPAVGHLACLALFGLTLVEFALYGLHKFPFTCSYLPGKSRVHIWAICLMLVPLLLVGAESERMVLEDLGRLSAALILLAIVWAAARCWTAWVMRSAVSPSFEEEPPERLVTLEIWDARLPPLVQTTVDLRNGSID